MPYRIEQREDLRVVLLVLPTLIQAIEDVLKQFDILVGQSGLLEPRQEQQTSEQSDVEESDSLHPLRERSYQLVVIVLAPLIGYRGPKIRDHAVSKIQSRLHKLGEHLDPKTIRSCLNASAKTVDERALMEL